MKSALLTSVLAFALAGPCMAGPTYISGHINNITVAGDDLLFKVDSGLPDNCVGSSYGWIVIPSGSRATQTLVMGLWLRGDMPQVQVTVYTTGLVNNYCRVEQIDPIE